MARRFILNTDVIPAHHFLGETASSDFHLANTAATTATADRNALLTQAFHADQQRFLWRAVVDLAGFLYNHVEINHLKCFLSRLVAREARAKTNLANERLINEYELKNVHRNRLRTRGEPPCARLTNQVASAESI